MLLSSLKKQAITNFKKHVTVIDCVLLTSEINTDVFHELSHIKHVEKVFKYNNQSKSSWGETAMSKR